MSTLTREDLLKERFGVHPYEIPGVGVIQVRPLSRNEALSVRGKDLPVEEIERILISAAMIEPKMTQADVQAWQDASPAGELEPLTQKIMELSGLVKEASKQAVAQFPR